MEKNEWLGVIGVIVVVGLIAGAIGAGITGNVVGDWNHCNAKNLCPAGEGDCDINSHCQTGWCHQNVGENYGLASTMDICEYKREIPCGAYGDSNGDGWVTTSDAELIKKVLVTGNHLSLGVIQNNADVSGDGSLQTNDAQMITQYLLNNRDTFPVCSSTPTNGEVTYQGVLNMLEKCSVELGYNQPYDMTIPINCKHRCNSINKKVLIGIVHVRYPDLEDSISLIAGDYSIGPFRSPQDPQLRSAYCVCCSAT